MYEYVDVVMFGFLLGIITNYWSVIHAPDSKDVVNSVFKGTNGCYMLRPIVVSCR